jgi:outer membrane lipoprotein-sorting protein
MDRLKALVLLAAALLVPQEKSEAEELFKKMEEKIAKATTVQVKVDWAWKFKTEGTVKEGSIAASILLEDGNRARLESKGDMLGQRVELLYFSNGEATRLVSGESMISGAPPKTLKEQLAGGLSRAGVMYCAGWVVTLVAGDEKQPDRLKLPVASGFTMGPKEKVGERETQGVSFALKGPGLPDTDCSIWIDLETHLPVKRETRSKRGREESTGTETYSEFKVDGKIDPTKFELPKESK